jgi:hypothetical protein
MITELSDTVADFENKITEGERLLLALKHLRKEVNIEVDKIRFEMNEEIDDYVNAVERFNNKHEIDLQILKRAEIVLIDSKWRDEVLLRDKFTCRRCGSVKQPTCHHIIPKQHQSEFTYDPSNGIVLCDECHREWHKYYDNGNGINLFIQWLTDYEDE